MEVQGRRLFIVDGMPGSGKTTFAKHMSNHLDSRRLSHRCVLELEQDHPLLLQGYDISSLEADADADYFSTLIIQKYEAFTREQLKANSNITIIESVLFQDTISLAFHHGMKREKLTDLMTSIFSILAPLDPALIYIYQVDVEGQWRYICNIRGNIWGPVSMESDDDFKQAGELWSGSQAFIRDALQHLHIPKLIIENVDYHWDEYNQRIIQFVSRQCARPSNTIEIK